MNPFELPVVEYLDKSKKYFCRNCQTQVTLVYPQCFNVCHCGESMTEFIDGKLIIWNTKNESNNRVQLT